MTELKFTPAQERAYIILKRGYVLKHPMTGNRICFLDDPKTRRGWKTSITVFKALVDAGLLTLQSVDYPFETWVLKQNDC